MVPRLAQTDERGGGGNSVKGNERREVRKQRGRRGEFIEEKGDKVGMYKIANGAQLEVDVIL